MKSLICFIGVIGSGKDYQANKLVQEQKYKHINFADELREMAWGILGWSPKNGYEYELFKQGGICIPNFGYIDGRMFLQNLGSELRKRNPDFWSDCWANKARDFLIQNISVTCSDLRYINELRAAMSFTVMNSNPTFIFCNYKSDRYEADNPHESEKLAQKILKDGYNDGDTLPYKYLYELIRRYNEVNN